MSHNNNNNNNNNIGKQLFDCQLVVADDVTMTSEEKTKQKSSVSDLESAASPVLPSASPSTSLWSLLYRDALGHIVQYLTRTEFLTASHCSRTWDARILRHESTAQQLSIQFQSADWIVSLIESPLSRHIRTIEFVGLTPLTQNDFYLLAIHMPQLHSLTCIIDISLPLTLPRRYPHSLTDISLTCNIKLKEFVTDEKAWERVHKVIDEISKIPAITSIHIDVQHFLEEEDYNQQEEEDEEKIIMPHPPSDILTPLLHVKHQLREFHFRSDGIEWTHEHINVVRQFHQLEDLHLEIGDNIKLLQLYTDDPVPSRIKRIHMCEPVKSKHTSFLSRLSSLTQFDTMTDLADLSFLSSFTHLEVLHLRPTSASLNGPAKIDISILSSVLTTLHYLHTLLIRSSQQINSGDLCDILSSTPHLRSLTLERMDQLESLEFTTRVPHLQQTLEFLTLKSMSDKVRISSELLRLTHLRALKRLELRGMFSSHKPSSMPPPDVVTAFSLRIVHESVYGARLDLIGTRSNMTIDYRVPSSTTKKSSDATVSSRSKKRKMKAESGKKKKTKVASEVSEESEVKKDETS